MKRLKDNSDVPKARPANLAQNKISSSKKKTRLRSVFPAEGMGSPLLPQQESQRRESL